MGLLLLALVLLVSIVMIPLGLPGLWVMIAAAVGYNALTVGAIAGPIGWPTLVGTVALGIVSEILDFTLAARFARKYGGSRRAGWGAIVGGFLGAFAGIPIPIVGSVIGAFLGAFAGAFIAEMSNRGSGAGTATRVAWGALLGRAAGAALKVGFGLAIAAWLLLAAWV
ncbi:protein of unknown function DUF456 (plasmid) [Gemmatirosa kalamazoonensis]|uniref:DUF456 domain-containing protein n=1 Tax=Gemmatirosa kalamazoonensis TaxID=861299 RepID=W0RNB7_9BACT|nr:DUF456 domain-containing protein [Gemmatirosa kalamazoonensis]AHG92231.1 protein of unknown function DUF456 [Gemmatirosa kalamazoonensis]